MKYISHLAITVGFLSLVATSSAQSVLFDFNNGPQYTGTPVDQVVNGIRAHFAGQGDGATSPAYSIQNTAQVIGLYPTGFTGLGLTPDSVFGADLYISFFNQSDGSSLNLTSLSMMVAPQELACDSSSTMEVRAYNGTTLVGTSDQIAPGDQTYTWPTINLAFSSSQTFNNVVIHFKSGPPTGGDWGGIFVADNLVVTPEATPEPSSLAGIGIGVLSLGLLRRRRKLS